MRVQFAGLIGGVTLLATLVSPVQAGTWAGSSLGKAQFGDVWNGKPLNAADLAGRVVLINVWSDGSPHCRKVLPGLAAYEKDMRGMGLTVIGVARQSTREAALEVAGSAGVDFPITDGATLPGVSEDKVPSYTVYDHEGEIIFKQTEQSEDEGGLSPATRVAIDKALSRAKPVLSVAVNEYQEKEIIKLAERANKRTALGKVLSDLDTRIGAGSEAERAEGERLHGEITGYGERVLADAESLRAERPHRHFDLMRDLAKQFKGHDIGDRAEAAIAPIKKDKSAMREVEASRLYEELKLAPEKDRKKIYGTLKKKYADTRYAQQAAEELGEPPPDAPPPEGSGKDRPDSGKDDDDEEEDD